ncbi:polysaccharide deacetylase family protein [Vibrio metschnikovii]|uniref:polysaccharide deacetylase family protein n=1 Tax=Vibrio metschnikovii TaxID=28172 RepID=UPI00165DBC42|nr:polysaccharide deacetylase family protein [Vibrio metschnikovii]
MISSNIYMKNVSVLLYHEIGPAPRPTANLDCFCSLAEFRKQMIFLKENNISVVAARDVFSNIGNSIHDNLSSVVLTFDDADTSFLKYVLPVLDEFGYPSTLFAVAGLLGKNARWAKNPLNAISLMTAEQLRSLDEDKVEIGSHSMTHPKLPDLPIFEATAELYESKARLEDILLRPVVSFAYPHGCYDASIIHLVKAAGYKYAFTTNVNANIHDPNNMFLLPRKYITYSENICDFSRKI